MIRASQAIRAVCRVLLLAGVGVACQRSPTSPVAAPTINLYAVVDGAFELRMHNPGTRPVTLAGCPDAPGVVVERRDGDRWTEFFSLNLLCLGIYTPTTLALAPGAALIRRVDVSQRGTFRARVHVGPVWGRPQQVLTSAPVTLP